jgi:hypothetical protein
MKSLVRVLFRLKTEVALAVLGAVVGVHLAMLIAPVAVVLAAVLAGLATGAGIAVLTRSGELTLAWSCPRLDALGLRSDSRAAPWAILRAAEATLAALEHEGGAYREFFPEARANLLKSAYRVLDANGLRLRAERALRDAPPGVARQHLERQCLRADQELLELTRMLQELRARLVAATAPMPRVDDAQAGLRALEQQTGALAEAIDHVRVGGPR